MSGCQPVRRFSVLIVIGILGHPAIFAIAQEIQESQQSVVVFDVKLDRLFEGAKALGGDLNELDAETPMENIFESIRPSELKRVHGSLSLPGRVDSLMTLGMAPELPIEFFVQIEFANTEACRMMTENVENRSNEVELEGKKYWTPEDRETGVYGHRVNDTTYEFGSKAYLVQAKRTFLTSALKGIWNNAPDEAVRIAVDLETPASFVTQAVEMGKESGDPQVEAYLDLLDNLTTIIVTADYQSDNLMTLVASAKDAEQAEEVKGGLDSLLMLAQMGGKMAVGPLAKEAPEGVAVLKKVLDSLAATQDGTTVKVTIPKPEGFAEAMAQLVAAGKKEAEQATESNDFRQLGLAIHNYLDTYKTFPFDVSNTNEQNNELSWRVRVLPFLEQSDLFDQMDISGGPNAEANASCAEKMPDVFGDDGKMANVVWIKSNAKHFRDITDGTSNTIMLIEYPKGEPWLENGGLTMDDAVGLVSGLRDGEELVAVLYDGSVRKLTNMIDKETLNNLFNPSDGNIIEDF